MKDDVVRAKPFELKQVTPGTKRSVCVVMEKLDMLPVGKKEVGFHLEVNGCYYGEKIKGSVIVEVDAKERVASFKEELGISEEFGDDEIEKALRRVDFDFQKAANELYDKKK